MYKVLSEICMLIDFSFIAFLKYNLARDSVSFRRQIKPNSLSIAGDIT